MNGDTPPSRQLGATEAQPDAPVVHDVDVSRPHPEVATLLDRLGNTPLRRALTPGAGLDVNMLVAHETQRGNAVRLLVVEQADRPVAAALVRINRRPVGASVTLAGADVVDRLAFAVIGSQNESDESDQSDESGANARAAVEALADAVWNVTRRHRGARLVLPQLRDDDPVVAELARRCPVSERLDDDPVPLLEWHDDSKWASKKTRNKYRAGLRRLEASDLDWSLERLTEPESVERALPATLALRSERELALGRADSFAESAVRDLHLARVRALLPSRDAQLWRLTIDGTLVAYAVLGRDGERVEFLDSRIRPGYETYAPGMVLFGAMTYTWFHHGFDGPDGDVREIATPDGVAQAGEGVVGADDADVRQVRTVDFGRGMNDFKRQFHTRDEPRISFTAWPTERTRAAWRLTAAASEAVRTPLRRARDRSPLAAELARRARTVQMRRKASQGESRG